MEAPQIFRFGPFELKPAARELLKNGIRIKLRGQPYLILELLLNRAGEVVTRNEIREKLWSADTFVDFEHGLNTSVKKLRQVLCDSVEKPRYIETIPRLGYRFIAAVENTSKEEAKAPSQSAGPGTYSATLQSSALENQLRESPHSSRKFWLVSLAAVLGLAIVSILIFASLDARFRWPFESSNTRAVGAHSGKQFSSIAVLPLENLSSDAAQEYFADGMTAELISDLAQIGSLRIISRTSAMHFKGSHEPLRQIAQDLNVDAVVEGSVLRAGDRVRITAELTDARSDRNLWSNSYERDQHDVLALQREVALAIAQQVKATLTSQERAALTTARPVDVKAYEAYLQGRFYLDQRTPDALTSGISYFQQAIAKDSEYALAYAGLADGYWLMASNGVRPAAEMMPKAKAAALHALELDETLAEAHTSLAVIQWGFEWDLTSAEKSYKRALELAPGYATAHHWYALYLSSLGRSQEAFAQMAQAQSMDPLSPIIGANSAWCYYLGHQYGQAIEQARKTLQQYPNFSPAHEVLGQAYAENAMPEEAISELQKAIANSGTDPVMQAELAYAYALSRNRLEALAILRKLETRSQPSPASFYARAMVYVGLGNSEEALRCLGKSYEERDIHLVNLKVHPVFARLGSDPRLQELERRVGLIPKTG
ncbi:MAG TPA: winged helix-turn-helix domain-containing protein [Terriglobales bacterium]|nr:winged helix-turn-helix domain-containing protein [Terriglobales bacterium]